MVLFYIILISPVLIAMAIWFALAIFIHSKIPEKFAKTQTTFMIFSFIVLGLIPTYDIIITNILGAYYCKTMPKSFVKEKIEYPASIYYDIEPLNNTEFYANSDYYLDGIKVKSLGLNGKDGQIYIYYFDTNSSEFENLKTIKNDLNALKALEKEKHDIYVATRFKGDVDYLGDPSVDKAYDDWKNIEKQHDNLYDKYDKLKKELMKLEITTKDKIPKFDYTAKKEEINLNKLASKFFKAIKYTITNNKTNEIIFYTENYYKGLYNLVPNIADSSKYDMEDTFCGCKNMEVGVKFLDIKCLVKTNINKGEI